MIIKPIDSLKQSAFPQAAGFRSGSILMLTLWSFCILSSLAVIIGYEVRQKIFLVRRLEEGAKIHLIAESGIKMAIRELKKEDLKSYYALKDSWNNNATLFKDVNIGEGRYNICYNYKNEASGEMESRWGFVDEARKINVNTASLKVLERLFQIILGYDEVKAQELAAGIVDWRDKDSELSIPLGSAEGAYYNDLEYPYNAKDSEFEVLDELLLVKGMDTDTFQKLRDYITIYGSGKININTASKEVLLSLGLTELIVRKILSFRAGEDGIEGTEDDNIFDSPPYILPKLSQFSRLSDSEVSLLSRIQDVFCTDSSLFMIKSEARLNGRKNTDVITCVVDSAGRILYYREM